MNELAKELGTFGKDDEVMAVMGKNSPQNLADSEKSFVSLVVKIIVNATLRECYEKGDTVSEVQ